MTLTLTRLCVDLLVFLLAAGTNWVFLVSRGCRLPALILQLDTRIDELDAGTRVNDPDRYGSDGSDDGEDGLERERDRGTERRATTAANHQTLLAQLQRGSGTRVLRNVVRTDYSGLGS